MAISKDPNVPEPTAYEEEVRQHFMLSPAPDSICFTCGEPAVHPVIYWSGLTGHIWLHKQCAIRLTIGLLHDVWDMDRLEELRDSLKDRG